MICFQTTLAIAESQAPLEPELGGDIYLGLGVHSSTGKLSPMCAARVPNISASPAPIWPSLFEPQQRTRPVVVKPQCTPSDGSHIKFFKTNQIFKICGQKLEELDMNLFTVNSRAFSGRFGQESPGKIGKASALNCVSLMPTSQTIPRSKSMF